MAKKKVTRESLRVGWTVYLIWLNQHTKLIEIYKQYIRDNNDKEHVLFWQNKTRYEIIRDFNISYTGPYSFLSKKKAKRKMMMLNEGLK